MRLIDNNLLLLILFLLNIQICYSQKLKFNEIIQVQIEGEIIKNYNSFLLNDIRKTKNGIILSYDSLLFLLDDKTGDLKYKIDLGKYKQKPKKVSINNNHIYVLNMDESIAFHFENNELINSKIISEQFDWYCFKNNEYCKLRWTVRQFLCINNPDETYSATKFPLIINLINGDKYFFSVANNVITLFDKENNFQESEHITAKGMMSNRAYAFNGTLNDSLFFQIDNNGVSSVVNPFSNQKIIFDSNEFEGNEYKLIGEFNEQPIYPKLDVLNSRVYLMNVIDGFLVIYEININ